ncbi:hypothetical protein Tco_1202437 [Tanacetum coccineum]
MRANSHHMPLLVAAVALQISVATAAAVGPAQARPSFRSISRIKSSSRHEVTIPDPVFRCSEIWGCDRLVSEPLGYRELASQFHLSQLRMSRVGHLHGLIYDDTCAASGDCIGILACRGLSRVSSPLHVMKSPSQIQSSAVVKPCTSYAEPRLLPSLPTGRALVLGHECVYKVK